MQFDSKGGLMSKDKLYRYYAHDALVPKYDKDTRILVVGSFPSCIGSDNPDYYRDSNNCMMKLLGKACGIEEKGRIASDEFLKYGIGFFDIIESCYSLPSFKDNEIVAPSINAELFKVINSKGSNIKVIIVTGQLAWRLFCEKASLINGDKIIYKIPSTSGLSVRYGRIKIGEIADAIRSFIKKGL